MSSRDRVAMAQLLTAMRLAAPSLPIGAFAYSQGLEPAVERGWIVDRDTAESWILGVLHHSIARFDLPLLARLVRARQRADEDAFGGYDAWVLAGRESAELRAEERHLGDALERLTRDTQGLTATGAPAPARSYLGAFAAAAVASGANEDVTMGSYAFAWLEHQTSAAIRLVPLGQTDGQRILLEGMRAVPDLVTRSRQLPASEIGTSAPGLAIASALHETQYTRLFRS